MKKDGSHYNRYAIRVMTVGILAALFCCTPIAVFAAKKTEAKNEIIVHVAAVKADGMLTLSSIGESVLADIVFPNPESAVMWLSEYALQHDTALIAGEEDRYGRTQVRGQLQEDMLNDGVAVMYATQSKLPDAWRAAEARARLAKRGVWDDRADTILSSPVQAEQSMGKFKVIEGTITRIYEAKSATYVNFGDDWHTDFSITIPAKLRRSMKPVLQQLKAGSVVRVRGTLYDENGPMVMLSHADNLEIR